jgi:hypothetical protein
VVAPVSPERLKKALQKASAKSSAEQVERQIEALQEAFGKNWAEKQLSWLDLTWSAKLFAHIQMDGEIKEAINTDPQEGLSKEVMSKGSAKVFFCEAAKFREKLEKEGFTSLSLAVIHVDFDYVAQFAWRRPYPGPYSSILRSGDWSRGHRKIDLDGPAVLYFETDRSKQANENTPVIAHCSFVFMAQGERKASIKTLSFDLYLEQVRRQVGARFSYPWKLKNLQTR